jgi:hypothetical protein
MSADSKDSPEIVKFRRLFARVRDWSDNDPVYIRGIALEDDGFFQLALDVLRVAGSIKQSEKSNRDLFTDPVDPKFISEWRDFEERFAGALLDILSDPAARGDPSLFTFDYYEQPDQWEVADFKASLAARSLDVSILFAEVQLEHAAKPEDGVTWYPLRISTLPKEVQRAFKEMMEALSASEDSYQQLKEHLFPLLVSGEESDKQQYIQIVRQTLEKRLQLDELSIEEIVKDTFVYWEKMKYICGLDIRGFLRRRALIPFVLFPRHVSARLSKSDLPSIFQNLRQAHDAFVFGAPAAALALMRSVMEMAVRDHYTASGENLDELIDSVASRLPRRANAARLHGLRQLANRVLHGESGAARQLEKTKREFELEIVSLFFVLRALVEGAPQLNVTVARNPRSP